MGKVGRAVIVGAENSSGQTIAVSVRPLGDLIQSLELLDGLDRSEDLLAANLHVISDIRKHGGLENMALILSFRGFVIFPYLNEVALVAMTVTASLKIGTLGLSGLDVTKNLVELLPVDLGSLLILVIERVSNGPLQSPD